MKNSLADVTFVSTVYNEARNIDLFMESLLVQTILPVEIIIVDSESSDGTFNKLEGWGKAFIDKGINFLLISQKCSIAEGRNIAIAQSSNEIICVSDAGCSIDPNWLEEIISPFEQPMGCLAVAGNFNIEGDNYIQKCFKWVGYKDKRKNNPSSRSFAFNKSCWSQYKYPEHLAVHEDTNLCEQWKKNGVKFCFAEKAIVTWFAEEKILNIYRKYQNYSLWWAKSGDRLDSLRLLQICSYLIPLLLLPFYPGFSLMILMVSLLGRTLRQVLRSLNNRGLGITSAICYFPGMMLVQMVLDVAVIVGIAKGKLQGALDG